MNSLTFLVGLELFHLILLSIPKLDFRDFWDHAFHFAHGAAAGEDAAGERDDGSKAGKG